MARIMASYHLIISQSSQSNARTLAWWTLVPVALLPVRSTWRFAFLQLAERGIQVSGRVPGTAQNRVGCCMQENGQGPTSSSNHTLSVLYKSVTPEYTGTYCILLGPNIWYIMIWCIPNHARVHIAKNNKHRTLSMYTTVYVAPRQ